MINCPKCGARLKDDSTFCMNCGERISVKFKCSNCGGLVNAGAPACPTCGAQFKQNTANKPAETRPSYPNQAQNVPVQNAPAQNAPAQNYQNAAPAYNAAANGAAGAPGANGMAGGAAAGIKSKVPLLALAGVGGVAVVVLLIVLITNLFGGGGKEFALYVKGDEVYYSTCSENSSTKLTKNYGSSYLLAKDGKTFFYKKDSDSQLYFCNIKDPDDSGKKISNNVGTFYVNDGVSIVTYRKDGDVYQYIISDEESSKVAKEVGDFWVSSNGKRLVYTNRDDEGTTTVYLKLKGDDEKTKIVSADSNTDLDIVYKNDDLTEAYFTRSERDDDGKYVTDLYYWKDGKDPEKVIKEIEGVFLVYEKDSIYYSKSEETDDGTSRMLYYFDGKENKVGEFTSALAGSQKRPAVAYYYKDGDDITWYIAVEENTTKMGTERPSGITMSDDGDELYYVMCEDGEDHGKLYKVKIGGSKPGDADEYDKEVYADFLGAADGYVIYFKEYKNGKGTLYDGKDKVAEDIDEDYMTYAEASKKFYILTDVSSNVGTLNVYNGGKLKKVTEDVYNGQIKLTNKGNILYLKDINKNTGKGDLFYYDGSEEKLDTGVSKILVSMDRD